MVSQRSLSNGWASSRKKNQKTKKQEPKNKHKQKSTFKGFWYQWFSTPVRMLISFQKDLSSGHLPGENNIQLWVPTAAHSSLAFSLAVEAPQIFTFFAYSETIAVLESLITLWLTSTWEQCATGDPVFLEQMLTTVGRYGWPSWVVTDPIHWFLVSPLSVHQNSLDFVANVWKWTE